MQQLPRIPSDMVYVGTSGWAYPVWKPRFYPADLPQRLFLEFYSRHLNTVEVNYTFCGRHVLEQSTADRWLAETPEQFVFTFRGPKPITHFHRHRLRRARGPVRQFETTLRPFRNAGRLGPVLFQLPETFTASTRVLDDFLRQWPRELPVSFEFRHPSWFKDDVYKVLKKWGAALCLSERDDLRTPQVLTAAFVYLRLRQYKYSADAIGNLAARLRRYAQRGDVFAFFRQDGTEGPFYAQQLLRQLVPAQAA